MLTTELSTADPSGKRKWVYPIPSHGFWWKLRLVTAILLMAWLFLAPWLSFNGNQLLFFDLVGRRIIFFGMIFWVHETFLFLSFVLFVFASILFLTSLFGRVFCGWACPITVFMEFVFRPIERWIEGAGLKQKKWHEQPLSDRIGKISIKWSLFAIVSIILGNTFVAYTFGSHRLIEMIADGPDLHWGPFLAMLISSAVIFFQYTWFREQICLFVCPYGRLQSILLDKDSLIVAYDPKRGEPRGKPSQTTGDCVDCKMCIKVCPTGIDIRQGLQLECVHCTQCIDACDDVMAKLKRPLGLIRYNTESALQGGQSRLLRPRVFIYGFVVLLAAFSVISWTSSRKAVYATLHREQNQGVFTIDPENRVVNPIRVHLRNQKDEAVSVTFESLHPTEMKIQVPEGEIILQPQEKRTVHILLGIPQEVFHSHSGRIEAQIQVKPSKGDGSRLNLFVLGPMR